MFILFLRCIKCQWNTGSAIFIAMHILPSFSIKNQQNWKFIRWDSSQWHYNNNQKHLFNMANIIFNDTLIYPGKFHRRHTVLLKGSRPILVAAPTSNYPANLEFCKPYSPEFTTQKSKEGSNPGSLRAIHLC